MKDVILSFKADEEIKTLLKAEAQKKDMSVSAIIRKAIKAYFQEVEQ